MRRLLALLLLVVGCSSGEPVAPSARPFVDGPRGAIQRATVVRVVDGDTIRVDVEGVEERVRYIGIDTPESVDPRKTIQPYALEASEANKSLVDGATVVLERDVSDRDRYGRLLRYVWLETPDGWVFVNHELVRRGYASAVSYPPDVRYQDLFREAERSAREEGAGLWASP